MRLLITLLFVLLTNNAFSDKFITRTEGTGFYKISKADIDKLGFKNSKIPMTKIKISHSQGNTPFFFTSRKSKLKANDDLVFFAEKLKGQATYQHPLDDNNGFILSKIKGNKKSKSWFYNERRLKKLPQCKAIFSKNHFETNQLLIRINIREYKKAPELWYWKKISQLNKKGFSLPFDLSSMNTNSDISIRAVFRSTNKDRLAKDIPDHEINIQLNGTTFKTLNWEDKNQFSSEQIKIPKHLIKDKNNMLTFFVPKRKVDGKTVIDIIMLDYYELYYEIKTDKITETHSLSSDASCHLKLSSNQIAYSQSDKKYAFNYIELNPNSKVHIGNTEELKEPKIEKLNSISIDYSKIDYLMITHPLFAQSVQPLAEFHRNNGSNVAVVDIYDIYQNYSYGVRELYAIKDFIKDVYNKGNGRLIHVLMVGDSSWDWRDNGKHNKYGKWANRQLPKNNNFTNFPHQKRYTEKVFNRDFIPTGQYHSSEGHSASDNWFVTIVPEKRQNGEDFIPDVAIGRFPVSTIAEIDTMVEKTINYSVNNKVGPWKNRILWITNSNKRFQSTSTNTSNILGQYGVMADNIFPKKMDGDNLKVQETLTNSIDSGNLIVHFLGHGGKSIWRIGPPDLRKNRDLFTLDHISKLKNSTQLPFVMSMSCYSAPFDHPFADSIGEKFIREPKVGAVAVLAASWRNTPNSTFSRYIMENIFNNRNNSIGQAILEGKRHYKGRTMVEMYNLLGDPALHLAIPSLKMSTKNDNDTVEIEIDTGEFIGKAKIETLDENSEINSSRIIEVLNNKFSLKLTETESSCTQGRIYAWDSERNIDAMASFDCDINKN